MSQRLLAFRAAANHDVLQNLSTLTNLKILSIQSNRLTKIEGLENLTSLEEFYISHNALTEISGLENNVRLPSLRISIHSRLTDIRKTSVSLISQTTKSLSSRTFHTYLTLRSSGQATTNFPHSRKLRRSSRAWRIS